MSISLARILDYECSILAWNTETIGDLYLVASAIIFFNAHEEGALTSYYQYCASAFSNLLELGRSGSCLETLWLNNDCPHQLCKSQNQRKVDANNSWLCRLDNKECLSTCERENLHSRQSWEEPFKRTYGLEEEQCSLAPARDCIFCVPWLVMA